MTRRRLLSPLFITTGVLLLIAAVGLRPALAALTSYYSKEAILPARTLLEFDLDALPSFDNVPRENVFVNGGGDVGTDELFMLSFRERSAGENGRSTEEITLFVTYYSNPRDQIPHTPEVCYRQGGAVVHSMRTIEIERPPAMAGHGPLEARILDISQAGVELVVIYAFYSNGTVYHDREQVRWSIGIPGDKYTYFSKVEIVAQVRMPADYEERVEQSRRLLTEGLQELITNHFPPDAELKRH